MAETLTQSQQMVKLATRLGTELKKVNANIGTLTNLKTTDKTALVAAINETVDSITAAQTTLNAYGSRITAVEGKASTNATNITANASSITTMNSTLTKVKSDLEALQDQVAKATNINDATASATTTYSSNKINSEITAAKQAVKDDLLGGAGAAYDTLKELADLITTNQDAIKALQDLAAGHVKFDAAQSLSDAQKTQARTNIGAADAATVTSQGTRLTAVESKATQNATDIATLKANVGDTSVDLVAAFEDALNAE